MTYQRQSEEVRETEFPPKCSGPRVPLLMVWGVGVVARRGEDSLGKTNLQKCAGGWSEGRRAIRRWTVGLRESPQNPGLGGAGTMKGGEFRCP